MVEVTQGPFVTNDMVSDIYKDVIVRIEPYKMPVSFDWIEELPKTSSGKLQRQALAKR